MSGDGQSPQESDSPLDKPRDQSPIEREASPETPEEQPQETQAPEEQPQDPGDRTDPNPTNQAASPPDPDDTGAGARARGNEEWGELPERTREIFRTEGGGDLPPQYRDWIDAYYRRLNRVRQP